MDGERISAIPDTSVSRTEDNTSNSDPVEAGLVIDPAQEWPEIDGRLSANISGATEAFVELRDESEPDDRGEKIGSVDISNLSAGDVFTIDLDQNITGQNEYLIYVWAEGAEYVQGLNDNPQLPHDSDDGNLSIVDGLEGSGPTNSAIYNVVEVGNLSQ